MEKRKFETYSSCLKPLALPVEFFWGKSSFQKKIKEYSKIYVLLAEIKTLLKDIKLDKDALQKSLKLRSLGNSSR